MPIWPGAKPAKRSFLSGNCVVFNGRIGCIKQLFLILLSEIITGRTIDIKGVGWIEESTTSKQNRARGTKGIWLLIGWQLFHECCSIFWAIGTENNKNAEAVSENSRIFKSTCTVEKTISLSIFLNIVGENEVNFRKAVDLWVGIGIRL